MINEIRTIYRRVLNKGFGLNFRQETPEEDQRTHQPKPYEYISKKMKKIVQMH